MPRFLPSAAGAVVHAGGIQISSADKSSWKGAALEGPRVPPGGSGQFAARVRSGLVRLGWLSESGDVNTLGTDPYSFGFGGTGKKSHGGAFSDFGEPFGAGDTITCTVNRTDGCLRIEYAKNERPLGVAFDFECGSVPAGLADAVLVPAVCGRRFEAELSDPLVASGEPVELSPDVAGDEMVPALRRYATAVLATPKRATSTPKDPKSTGGSKSSTAVAVDDLREFFLGGRHHDLVQPPVLDGAAARWVRSAFLQDPEARRAGAADLDGCREVRRVARTVALPSGPVLALVDSQPASRADADRCFAQNVGLWESLPRGHAEVRSGSASGELLREVVGLRKFGNAEERFGPLAHEAGCSRRAALTTLPAALDAGLGVGAWSASLVFLTKENGEMCKVSFFKFGQVPYLVVGSKNVVLAVSAASREAARADLAAYTEERFEFAREMAEVFVAQLFERLSGAQREELVAYVCEQGATLCGESISPQRQHIQSYRDAGGQIAAQIRFFAVTAPQPFESGGLTLLEPAEAMQRLRAWGLQTVEACDEARVSDAAAVRAAEEKHLLLPNREGAVVYLVVRALGRARTAVVYKWKNSWYVTARALREKFCARASEGRIWSRIRSLHVHHPNEEAIVRNSLDFYRWVLVLLPSSGFKDVLSGAWVSLKASFDDFVREREDWAQLLPQDLQRSLGGWLAQFPEVHAALQRGLPREKWIGTLTRHRRILDAELDRGVGAQDAAAVLLRECAPLGVAGPPSGTPASAASEAAQDSEPVGLTAVLVRGLQGSGKSTLCRGLRALLGGQWVNQDEVAAACGPRRGGPTPRELFLAAVEAAVAQADTRYVFIDKIHTLRQHRDDVRGAVARGASRRPADCGRTCVALLNLVHPEDEEGQVEHALPVCAQRVSARGAGHLTFLPQASAVEGVIAEAGRCAEVLGDDEKLGFELFRDLDLTLQPADLLRTAVEHLAAADLLAPEHSLASPALQPQAVAEATEAAFAHERELQGRWKTRYWYVALAWEELLWGCAAGSATSSDCGREALRSALASSLDAAMLPVEDPHVTLLWLGEEEPDEGGARLDALLSSREGEQLTVAVDAVTVDDSLGLLALRVRLLDAGGDCGADLCANAHPHVTVAKRPEVQAVLSNAMLQRQAAGDAGVRQIDLPDPVRVAGVVSRKLVSEPGCAMALVGALPEMGNPICDLGLATTGDAVDVWFTYDARIRWHRLRRTFDKLFCTVSEPLRYCRGLPPQLRGKQWFTFHERPLSSRSISTLRALEKQQQLQTLHIGACYFHLPDILSKSKEQMQVQLEGTLAERGAEALQTALAVWREVRAVENGDPAVDGQEVALEDLEGHQDAGGALPKFYIQCKHVGSQELTTCFKQALAAAVGSRAGWEPVIKGPDVTLSVVVRGDWVLLGLVLPPLISRKSTGDSQGQDSGKKDMVRISKALTQVLRHSAVKLRIKISPDGFCRMDDVLRAKTLKGLHATADDVKQVVRESDKQRFEIKELDGELMIRAAQGHSMQEVDENELLQRLSPSSEGLPEVCVHGTYRRHLESIASQGLLAGGTSGGRNHVHFSRWEPGDKRVISGMRGNCEIAIYVDLKRALEDGLPFFLSANEVILTPGRDGAVPPDYILRVRDLESGGLLDFGKERNEQMGELVAHDGLELDGAHMEGGGQVVRSACAYSVLLGRPVHIVNVRGGRQRPGLRPAHVAAVGLIRELSGAKVAGAAVGSRELAVAPVVGQPAAPLQQPVIGEAGTGGSVSLMLQAALPVMLARSAEIGGKDVRVVLRGGTNVAPSAESCTPQVDYAQAVLLPSLRRLFGLSLHMEVRRRGFANGGGEVEVCAGCPEWPLRPLELIEQGDVARARGIVYRSAGVPSHVLPRMLEGVLKKKPAGAAVVLRERLPDVPIEWERLEVDSSLGADACGILVVIETTTGCLLAGDSMGRKGVPAEQVGEEAAKRAIDALATGACADAFLEDQLVLFMALASGRSRLRVGGASSLHAETALWLAERFGATVHVTEAGAGRIIEVTGIGAPPQ